MIKTEFNDNAAQVHNGVTHQPYTTIFWCGKVERYIRETPQILTPEEQARHDKFVEQQKINPWPVCPKCKKAKDKNESSPSVMIPKEKE